MAERRGYPVGMQDFPTIREKGSVYVDKTGLVYRMTHEDGTYFFLSRPRRFGKSLLISTLRAYFEGRRELFEGLELGRLEREWTSYPVVRLDMSAGRYYDMKQLSGTVNMLLEDYEERYGLRAEDKENFGVRLSHIIRAAHAQTGQRVVVLVDEYDAPMLDTMADRELQDRVRDRVRGLFSPLKAEAEHLRFVFLAGITKFSQLSVFSELNNLRNLTFDPNYEAICGITEEELLTVLRPDIEGLRERLEGLEHLPLTYDQTVARLKEMYDGYHFSVRMTDIYNPWSLLNAFAMGMIENFWFQSGTPSSLLNLLKAKPVQMTDVDHVTARLKRFDAPTEHIDDPIPVLFQSGYLTLKRYDAQRQEYELGFPNKEVREGFSYSLYKYYTPAPAGSDYRVSSAYTSLCLGEAGMEQFLDAVGLWYHGIPYSVTDRNQNEQFYQALLYALLAGSGADVQAEQQTADGRIDIALRLPADVYIMEFKLDASAGEAMAQMKAKGYADAYAADARHLHLVAINLDSRRRTIDSYLIETLR